ncbi:MAG: hypothetical protein HY217_04805 [Candidatus Rokubacteria bacterium]|nr:hypothetical protein [Candidatus Rokubacteria bacterium]
MKNIRLAMRLIWTAYGALALAVALFAVTIHWIRPHVGVVVLATFLLGAGGTAAGLSLLSGSVLGTHALMQQKTLRRPVAVVTVLVGGLGVSFVGWIAWGFWTHY